MIYRYIGGIYAVLLLFFSLAGLFMVILAGAISHNVNTDAEMKIMCLLLGNSIAILIGNLINIFVEWVKWLQVAITGVSIVLIARMALYCFRDIFSGETDGLIISGAVFLTGMIALAVFYIIGMLMQNNKSSRCPIIMNIFNQLCCNCLY